MTDESKFEKEIVRGALAPGKDCPSLDELQAALDPSLRLPAGSPLSRHLEACPHCRTELHLLQVFQAGEVSPGDEEKVRRIASQLRRRAPEIIRRADSPGPAREGGWRRFFAAPWLRPAALACAGLLVIVAVGLQLRQGGAPALHPAGVAEQEVLRTGSVAVLAPVGDQTELPRQIRWRAAAGAAGYKVQLLEVDGAELWNVAASGTAVQLPDAARARITPARTIFCKVTALDASGRKIADSGPVRFRLLPNLH